MDTRAEHGRTPWPGMQVRILPVAMKHKETIMVREEDALREMIEEHGLRYAWRCRTCGYEYEDVPGCNEGATCPCGAGPCEKVGESYAG